MSDHHAPTPTQRAAHATLWSALEITARYGVQFFVVLVLARLLSPSDFGLIAMLLVFTSIGALLVDSGFSTSLIQRQHTTADDETTVFWFTCVISLVLFLVLWIAAPVIANFYQQAELGSLMRLVAWVLPLSALSAVPDAILTQQLRFKVRAKAEAIGVLGSATVAISLAWGGYGVWSLAWQIVTAAALRGVLLWIHSGWRPGGRFNIASFRSLFSFGSYMFLANLLGVASLRLQSLLIGKLFAPDTLGYYTLAQNVQQAPSSFMSGILNRVGLPVFSSVADQPQKLIAALRFSLRIALFLFVPCIVGIAVIAKPLIIALYGARWAPAAPLLTILSLSAIFWPLHVLNLAAIGARGRSDLVFRLEVIKRIISIGLIIAGSPWGAIGIAWAVLISSLFAAVINTWYSKKLLGYGAVAQLRDQLATLMLTVCAAASGWAVLHLMATGKTAMLLAIVVAAIAYLGGAVISRSQALRELLQLCGTMATGKEYGAADQPDEPDVR
ncbi:MAG TPA: lipopolysaccharide biosynthesis protein [Dokdonella sp.]|uniref:lipopolysaccharide biosynthesis protein n=1 Tax=Dokdonella sp. TaxID=2291710 RepID=UPI002D7E85FE|nr:lipopolysaccharide biosynthesis protein [Dokdonella sp.]HET9034259.1 lipopolysaccharide biosynthesis protein [Dokdonella sp.]